MKEIKKEGTFSVPEKTEGIDLLIFMSMLWRERLAILRTTLIFALVGISVALLTKKEYTATAIMVPQINDPSAKLSGLSSIASLAGFNLDMGNGMDISPVLYPQIVNSIPFKLQIIESKYKFSELDQPISLYDYYTSYYKPGVFEVVKKYTIGLPGVIMRKFQKKKDIEDLLQYPEIQITSEQNQIIKKVDHNVKLIVNEKEGYISLESKFHQPYLAAQVGTKAKELLQSYITSFRIKKASARLDFILGRYEEKKDEFEKAQESLAIFRDKNKNISSALLQTNEEKLENEYQLAFDVYSELAKQLEQARIKVKEDTPVFSVIKDIVVPVEKSAPKRLLIIFMWTFIGLLVGTSMVFFRPIISVFHSNMDEK